MICSKLINLNSVQLSETHIFYTGLDICWKPQDAIIDKLLLDDESFHFYSIVQKE